MLRYTTRPVSDPTRFTGKGRETSRFTASWSDTLDLLEREYGALRGRDLVIEVDVRERDIRNDGLLRGDARASSPAVVVAFESKHGPLLYACDRYERQSWSRSSMDSWQHNVRAIALTLEALRAVDRHGASQRGEQYRGYKAIGGGPIPLDSEALSVAEAARVLASLGGTRVEDLWAGPRLVPAAVKAAHRSAARLTHPDHGGTTEAFQRAAAAHRVLVGALIGVKS